MSNREQIPSELKRRILIEAGHRCAIPTCRHPTTEIAHITPYSKVMKHEYSNLIALCPNCHRRFDNGEIDRKSMQIYKKKLTFLTDRYSRLELNVLDHLRNNKRTIVHGYLSVKNLMDEKLIQEEEVIANHEFDDGSEEDIFFSVILTEKGQEFLKNWGNIDDHQQMY